VGLSACALRLLLDEARREPFAGSVVVLGKQDVWFTEATLRACAAAAGVQLRDVPLTLSAKPGQARAGYLSDDSMLKALGFTDYAALDVSDYEATDIITHNLNSPTIPPEIEGRFDVVIDGGTLEHVFHLPNAMSALGRMVHPQGRVIHASPSSNHVDHGFYMFSPTFFWDYYSANGFELPTVHVVRYQQRHLDRPWDVYEYTSGALDPVSFGGLDDSLFMVWCVARKTADSTTGVIPEQRAYVRVWEHEGALGLGETPPRDPPRRRAQAVALARRVLTERQLDALFRASRLVHMRPRLSLHEKDFGLRLIGRYEPRLRAPRRGGEQAPGDADRPKRGSQAGS
jgi:hypothetical protein